MRYIRNVVIASVMMTCFQAYAKNNVVVDQKLVAIELNDQTKQNAINLANTYAEQAKFLPQDVYQKLNSASIAGTSFSEEQLEKLL